ncbi:hypothetical protein CDN99_23835 [Roseateles aquatilis]|uniref:Response regulatory domain-containing protein n=1 Tax=Roseateles aquatilis TaxID=431061 RepID=A0A246IX36_9BURK|nr:response regulator [Roseateles aquatilis]OWQ84764.1 hypothetical protein CDN99_23835 [Roseateles aquatilis]
MAPNTLHRLKGRVLFIEDNEVNIRLMQCWAEGFSGLTLTVAENGLDGIAAYEREQPDAVILDMNLPDLGGVEVLRRLLALSSPRAAPIALLTGNVDAESVQAAVRAGACAFWFKPVDFRQLETELGDLLAAGCPPSD